MTRNIKKHAHPNPLVAREPSLVAQMSAFRDRVHDMLLEKLAARTINRPASTHAKQPSNTIEDLEATSQILRVLTKVSWEQADLDLFDTCWRQATRSQVFGEEFESERFRIQQAVDMARQAFLATETANRQESLAAHRQIKPTPAKRDKRAAHVIFEPSRISQPTLFGMKTYHGTCTEQGVTVVVEENGIRRELDPRLDLRNHSPTLFEWGYGGSGPAQLALALAADVLGDDEKAQDLYQRLKFRVIGRLPREGWALTEDQLRQELTAIEQEDSRGR